MDECKTFFHRFVHLDLKGAAFKVSYYEQLLPLIARIGATGSSSRTPGADVRAFRVRPEATQVLRVQRSCSVPERSLPVSPKVALMRCGTWASVQGLHHLVEPMVWHYFPQSEFRLKQSMWDKYLSIFPNLWIGSAFKGGYKDKSDVDAYVLPYQQP
ncbi:hypothetical protein MRX96_025339 [Rhipicephalus microplus]